ncbi:hypothetical protein BOX15_Mlig030337g2 [Macrostomum lignano]|uniref:Disintegrin domain-containing protein n=1 Tax=Macrostomum lignano TaxID=282301 RepID=A0A267FIG4_9PLAT|nr:hypothetical protein BOX15_Mlig030337g2 [Macrostomum lignano]
MYLSPEKRFVMLFSVSGLAAAHLTAFRLVCGRSSLREIIDLIWVLKKAICLLIIFPLRSSDRTVAGRMASHSHRKWIGLSLPSRGQLAYLCILVALQPHQVNGAKSPQSVDEYLHSQLSEFELLQPARLVSRRSLGSDALPTQHLHFVAFSRQFHLVLKPDRSYASQLHPVVSTLIAQNGSRSELKTKELLEDFFTGYIDDQPGSRVTGYADRHRFHLTVYETDFNVLNIEPLSLLTGNQSEDRTLVYYDSGMNSTEFWCGLHNPSGNETLVETAAAAGSWRRYRRSADLQTSSTRRRVCRLQLIADHAFVAHVGSVSAALKFLIKATDDANRIFFNSVFTTSSGEVNFTAISFEVSSLVAMTGPTAVPASEAMHFNDANIHREVSAYQLLEAFADFRQNGLNLFAHCLNHLVAFRRLKKRLLGLAYQGTQFRSQPGGLCSNPSYSIHGRHTYVARNVGLTTFSNNKGEAISTRQATLVMAHELAHNLGAAHDPPAGECNPGPQQGGHFLMHVKAVTGKDINHSRLSVCSRKAIADVLASREADCFSNKTGQVCGNGRREVGEDCDAGPAGDDCCGPDCRLRPGASCSDANSACCIDCRPAAAGFVCRRAQPLWPCRSDAKCDGRSVACPAPETTAPLANGTSCLRGLGACAGGDCLTRCQLVGKTDCSCPLPADACSQCCRGDRDGDACEPHRDGATAAVRRPDCPEAADFAGGGLTVRMWRLVGRISGESLGDILRCNLVFIVVLLSLLAWVPACCIYEHSTQLSRRARADAVLPVYS